ncbi:hypothetical protein PIROE2DRAFT_10341 [Piromyces sp. E2]|nr:hypothetical protein PIROE2DRAFT_10341 [Piromyces sp. E2]|eukprot:OUM63181.1 hypothetical protein PIROE2DRAFT_10341 [Piromyces sp. E2]
MNNSDLPGEKIGISAACIGGYTLIINKYITEEKKIAAGKIIDFLLSKEIQIKYAISHGKHSALDEIYYDEELCSKINCELFRNMQMVSRPTRLLNNYDDYSLKFRSLLYDYLYGNATVDNTLKQMDYIASIYTVDLTSPLGLIIEKHKEIKIVKNLSKTSIQDINFYSKIINYHYYTNCYSQNNNESSVKSNSIITSEPNIKLYTSIIPSQQLTDISNCNK